MPKENPIIYTSNIDLTTKSMYDEIKWPSVLKSAYLAITHIKNARKDKKYNLLMDCVKSDCGKDIKISYNKPEICDAVVIYLHTIFGNNFQQSLISKVFETNKLGFVCYDRSYNPRKTIFGSTDELKKIIKWVTIMFNNKPIILMGASAGTILLSRFCTKQSILSKYNIIGAVMISPSFDLVDSYKSMNPLLKAYIKTKVVNNKKSENDEILLNRYNPKYFYENIKIPCLIITSQKDEFFHKKINTCIIDTIIKNSNIVIVSSKYGRHNQFYDKEQQIPYNMRISIDWITSIIYTKK